MELAVVRISMLLLKEDMKVKNMVGDVIAKHMGAEADYQGRPPGARASERSIASREAYQKMRTVEDVIEDSKLYAAKSMAKDMGEEERADSIEAFIKALAVIRGGNKNKKKNVEVGLGHGGDDAEILRRLREKRKEALDKLRIK